MKRIFIAAALLMAAVACDNSRVYYCESNENRTYYDANAEFDTLSYAVGMNLGLGLSISNKDVDFDRELLHQVLKSTVARDYISKAEIDENAHFVERFNTERMRPRLAAQRMGMMSGIEAPDSLPEILNEEFTRERVSKAIGFDMANYIRRSDFPINIYWVEQAMIDAIDIKEAAAINDNMKLSQTGMTDAFRDFFYNVVPAYEAERSRAWLAEVAKRDGVKMHVVNNDTLYYRINTQGSSIRPYNYNDTVSFKFELYTRRGQLVESTSERANVLRKQLEGVRNDKNITDSLRQVRIATLEESIAATEQPTIPLGQFMLNGAKHALQLIGEGGNITVWLPASLGYGARGNRVAHANEALVFNITLCDVKHSNSQTLSPADLTPKKPGHTKIDPGKVVVHPKKRE